MCDWQSDTGTVCSLSTSVSTNGPYSFIKLSPITYIIIDFKIITHEGRYENSGSYFFLSDNTITVVLTFAYIMGTSCTKFRLFFHKFPFISFVHFCHYLRLIPLHCQHSFPTFVSYAVCLSLNTLRRSVAAPHARCVSARRRQQHGFLGVRPFGGPKLEVGG